VGGGDAKLLGTAVGFLGPQLTVVAFLAGSSLGGVAALGALVAARRRRRGGVRVDAHRPATLHATPLPYTVPLALGVVVALAFDGVAGGPR
jgi:Flp pilus assembly protein protease CpaA